MEDQISGIRIVNIVAVDVAACAQSRISLRTVSARDSLDIGIESSRLVPRVTQQHWALRGMRAARGGLIWLGSPLMALHAEVLVGIRHIDRETQLPCHWLTVIAPLEPVRIMANGAGNSQIVLSPWQVSLGVIRGHSPGSESVSSLMARPARRGHIIDEGTVLLLQRHGVGRGTPLLDKGLVEPAVAVGAAPGQRG